VQIESTQEKKSPSAAENSTPQLGALFSQLFTIARAHMEEENFTSLFVLLTSV